VIDTLVPQVESAIKKYLGFNPERVVYAGTTAEYLSGTGHERLQLRKGLPVISIQNLYEDNGGYFGQLSGGFASSSLLTRGSDYILEYTDVLDDGTNVSLSGHVLKIGAFTTVRPEQWLPTHYGKWPMGQGNIKVEYTAGWSTLPGNIVLATNIAVSHHALKVRQNAENQSDALITSEHLGDYSVSYATEAETEDLDAFLPRRSRALLQPYRRYAVI
jgi:hypothetical protein